MVQEPGKVEARSGKATDGRGAESSGPELEGALFAAADGKLAGSAPESQAWFMARLLDQTTHPFALADFDGRIVLANRAFAELIGYTVEELRALTVWQLTPKHWVQSTRDHLGRLRATGKAEHYEKEYLRKDGSMVPVEAVVELYRDEHDRPQGFFAFLTDITDRKRAEGALRESEERYRRLYDEAPVGYHEIDADGIILGVNRTECELLGYAREEMVGRPIFEFVAEADREESRRAVREKIEEQRPLRTIERKYRTRDGRMLTLAIEERLARDAQGKVVGIRSALQDVTAKRSTEDALVASERRARALFEGIDDAVIVHDLAGAILDANPAACSALGYEREQLLALTMRQIEEHRSTPGFDERISDQMRRGRLSFEAWLLSSAGRSIPVEVNASLIQFEGHRAVLAVIRDITERRALEETKRQLDLARLANARAIEAKNLALMESETRYRQLTEGNLDPIVVSDSEGRITLFNPAAERTFGYQAEEILGQPLTTLIPVAYRSSHEEGLKRFVATRSPRLVGRTIELFALRKSGETFPIELSLSAVDVGDQLQFIGAIRDQTERQRMRSLLMQTEKLASIGLLSAGVAHEINNPLSFVGNNLAVLDRDLRGVLAMLAAYEGARERLATVAPEVVSQIDQICTELDWGYVRDNLDRMLTRTRDGVQRVAKIVGNLRGLAHTAPPRMEEAHLSDLVASALEMVQTGLRRAKIEATLQLDPLPRITCVPAHIHQVVVNLLVNAIQAIESTQPPQPGLIKIALTQEGADQVLSICDNGCGIEAEHLPRLFDPFFTTKPVGEGTGLGLAISHGIVSGHGGRIDVDSKPGEGTCFRVRLPLKQT
jgi:two-component system, NtrC family, sensor kinase